ncbi:ribosomal RNA small subunit methyltransferase H [Gemmatimonadetes bacterium T265]|nr:ribosomal RNA small subunit methyltransferase H [Gemmatimonadetes bacterium T265]
MAAEIVRYLVTDRAAPTDSGRSDRLVLDGTLGGGGHALALLEAGCRVVALDRDPDALAAAGVRLSAWVAAGRLRPVCANYADASDALAALGESAPLDGVLLDLGISSHQIDMSERGFSFRQGAPLDMRMGGIADSHAENAADVLNGADEATLAALFREHGGEPRAGRLAREIVRRRARVPMATSDDLVRAIRGAFGPRTGPADFARLFQAVRIAVNDEAGSLARALPALRDLLRPGARVAVLSYHSGEDRVVKHAFRDWSTACVCPPRQPACTCGHVALGRLVTRKAERPSASEIARNPRARSATLRVWERAA